MINYDFSRCTLCPRMCSADRINGRGFCGMGVKPAAAKAYLHMWEEPCLSGSNGAGTVFFSGCSLKCCYCQNYKISDEGFGREITVERLGEIFLELQEKGAHCIDLVSPTHFVPQIISALENVKGRLTIPVAYNCGGYERVETLKMLEGYIDIYLPDFKYFDSEAARKYSGAADYPRAAMAAIKEMCRQTAGCVFEGDLMKRGVIVRHMTLPTLRHDSVRVLQWLADNLPRDGFRLSLMSQYTPFHRSSEFKEINRRISTFEYSFVLEKALELGLEGYMQERSSAKEEYTPEFDLCGI